LTSHVQAHNNNITGLVTGICSWTNIERADATADISLQGRAQHGQQRLGQRSRSEGPLQITYGKQVINYGGNSTSEVTILFFSTRIVYILSLFSKYDRP
jgi:hypothetical protein